jgi:hypothetical protein
VTVRSIAFYALGWLNHHKHAAPEVNGPTFAHATLTTDGLLTDSSKQVTKSSMENSPERSI